ncbi:hypothetical protein [Sphingomonas sp. PAMC 26617]|uniref:hypothetical protein n=1 Tax=Sphingomonas sp. PAMC 26617 TaxID=1112216 RepID=UPI000288F81A
MNVLKPAAACSGCRGGKDFTVDLAMAFQPIVDMKLQRTYAYEALVRGPNGESAHSVLSQLSEENRYSFDQRCRIAAIRGAVTAGILNGDAKLSIISCPIRFIPRSLASSRRWRRQWRPAFLPDG